MRLLLINCSSFILFEKQSGMVGRIFKGKSKSLASKLAFAVLCHLTSLSIRFLTCKWPIYGITLRINWIMWKNFVNRESRIQMWDWCQLLMGMLFYLQWIRIWFSHILFLQRESRRCMFSWTWGNSFFDVSPLPSYLEAPLLQRANARKGNPRRLNRSKSHICI